MSLTVHAQNEFRETNLNFNDLKSLLRKVLHTKIQCHIVIYQF